MPQSCATLTRRVRCSPKRSPTTSVRSAPISRRLTSRTATGSSPATCANTSGRAASPSIFFRFPKGKPVMYAYDELDRTLLNERVEEFRDQVKRRLSGELTEDEFKMLRLQNGVYLQLHAYMFRVAIPYGTLSSQQLRRLAHVARKYDRGYGHFTTRQNIQFNWPKLVDVPDILAELATVEMHAIQTSGNCIRNVTADHFAGATDEEIEDPRPLAEIIRQWSSLHPEFVFLARKFKIAVGATRHDRAALQYHDMAVQIVKNAAGRIGYKV